MDGKTRSSTRIFNRYLTACAWFFVTYLPPPLDIGANIYPLVNVSFWLKEK
jgi:hypothetical protein